MIVDPDLRALRGDPAAQRQAQTAMEAARGAWRANAGVAPILADLARYGSGEPLKRCSALAALMKADGVAANIVGALVSLQCEALAAAPLGQVPFRHQSSGGLAIVQLARAGEASLSLIAYEDQPGKAAETAICFSDGTRHEIVLAGSAAADLITIVEDRDSQVVFARERRELVVGDTLELPGFAHAKHLRRIDGRLVVLRLARTPDRPLPTRQFDLASGALIHRASGDRRESRHELAMALLGRMKRRDAAPVLAEMTRDGSTHLRWQALRECLALDTAAGFAALSTLARDAGDPLCAPAAGLRAQLVEAHPQLHALTESTPCLAN